LIPGVSADTLGEFATLEIDTSVYGEPAIFKAAYWFTDRFYLYLKRSGATSITVELRHKTRGASEDLARAVSEFCNSLLDFKLRQTVLAETSGVREALVARAFAEGLPGRSVNGAVSRENDLPCPGDGYREDRVGAGRH
jgi:His-Xaa-Ser system protein HxsD